MKLIVMSDLHLVPEGQVSHGLDTSERLEAAVASVNSLHADADLCVLAGDLADFGEADAYQRLADIMGTLTVPWRLTLGNHDDRPTALQVLGADLANPDTGCVDFEVAIGDTVLLVLDSSEPGVVGGVLTEAQRAWTKARLEAAGDRPVIVILHHHIVPLRMQVDRIILAEAEAFLDLLAPHRNIRQVIAGHVHLPTVAISRGIPITTLAGGTYSVSAHVPGVPGDAARLDTPGQYAVVLSDADSTVVHFEDFLSHALRMPKALFPTHKPKD